MTGPEAVQPASVKKPAPKYRDARLPRSFIGRLVREFQDRRELRRNGDLVPQFLGIGAHKGGSTWLYYCLRQCKQDCFLPLGKEMHYFDWQIDLPLAGYLELFKPGRGKILGEVTPNYGAIRPEAIHYIHRLNPRMKMVLIMRNPIERAWSHAVMDLVKYGGLRPDELTDEVCLKHFDNGVSFAYGDYATQLEQWRAVFPREQVKVCFFEEISQRPRELIIEVMEYLGVDPEKAAWQKMPHNEVVHEGVKADFPPHLREYLTLKYKPVIERLIPEFGERAEAWLRPLDAG